MVEFIVGAILGVLFMGALGYYFCFIDESGMKAKKRVE